MLNPKKQNTVEAHLQQLCCITDAICLPFLFVCLFYTKHTRVNMRQGAVAGGRSRKPECCRVIGRLGRLTSNPLQCQRREQKVCFGAGCGYTCVDHVVFPSFFFFFTHFFC